MIKNMQRLQPLHNIKRLKPLHILDHCHLEYFGEWVFSVFEAIKPLSTRYSSPFPAASLTLYSVAPLCDSLSHFYFIR